jgi:hypothetical protein
MGRRGAVTGSNRRSGVSIPRGANSTPVHTHASSVGRGGNVADQCTTTHTSHIAGLLTIITLDNIKVNILALLQCFVVTV